MLRWTLPLLTLIALSTPASADDEDTAQPQVEQTFQQWSDKVIIDTRSRALLFVWFDGSTVKVPFSRIGALHYLPAYQGSASEVVVETTAGERHLMVMGSTARGDAQVIAAILDVPLQTTAASSDHLVPTDRTSEPGPRLTLGAISGPFAAQSLGEALEEESGFSTTDTVVYEAPEGFIKPTDGEGELERSGIALGIRTKMSTYKSCYQRQLQRVPNLQGTVTVEFVIGEDGIVERARVASSSLSNAEVEQCLIANLEGSQFPSPRNGTVVVSYPFNFSRG